MNVKIRFGVFHSETPNLILTFTVDSYHVFNVHCNVHCVFARFFAFTLTLAVFLQGFRNSTRRRRCLPAPTSPLARASMPSRPCQPACPPRNEWGTSLIRYSPSEHAGPDSPRGRIPCGAGFPDGPPRLPDGPPRFPDGPPRILQGGCCRQNTEYGANQATGPGAGRPVPLTFHKETHRRPCGVQKTLQKHSERYSER